MACNSDKCHCPACTEEKRLKGLEHRVEVLELRESNRDMMRVLDHKSRWQESRHRFHQRCSERAAHRDNFKRRYPQTVYVAGADVIKIGPNGFVYKGYGQYPDLIWRWVPVSPGLWRKFNIMAAKHFGMTYEDKGIRTPDGNPIHGSHGEYGGEGRIGSAVEFSTTKRVGEIEQTERVVYHAGSVKYKSPKYGPAEWGHGAAFVKTNGERGTADYHGDKYGEANWVPSGFTYKGARTGRWHPKPGAQAEFFRASVPDWAKDVPIRTNPEGNLEYAMTPFMIEVVLHAFSVCELFPRYHVPAYREAKAKLIGLGLIENTTADQRFKHPGWNIRATEKGRVYVEALKAVPMPVQTEPEWRMP